MFECRRGDPDKTVNTNFVVGAHSLLLNNHTYQWEKNIIFKENSHVTGTKNGYQKHF